MKRVVLTLNRCDDVRSFRRGQVIEPSLYPHLFFNNQSFARARGAKWRVWETDMEAGIITVEPVSFYTMQVPDGMSKFIEQAQQESEAAIKRWTEQAARAYWGDRPQFHRPPKELYVRVTVTLGQWTFEPAVEFYAGDNFDDIAKELDSIARAVADLDGGQTFTPMDRSEMICKIVETTWPGRGHFCETWQEGRKGFAQSVQPVGFPINR